MDENDISELQKEGLIVNIMEDDPVMKTPGADAKMFTFMVKNGKSMREFTESDTRSIINLDSIPASDNEYEVYLLNLDGPLLEEYRKILKNNNITLLEYIPTNNYTVKLTKDQLNIVKSIDFIKSVSLYSPDDSGPVISTRVVFLCHRLSLSNLKVSKSRHMT